MTSSLFYFITSLFTVAGAVFSFKKIKLSKAVLLLFCAFLYVAFCFIAYGKMEGFIPTVTIGQIIEQKGYDTSVLPLSISTILNAGFMGATVFNLVTAGWIIYRGSFWKWCLTVVVTFCICCACSGSAMGMSPLYALFGGCCGIMAVTGWILGLTYIEFCVIGNIWVPGIAIILAGGYLTFASCKAISSKNNSTLKKSFSVFTSITGIIQIITTSMIIIHYIGTMNYAFYTCVKDLRNIAAATGTTYETVNIFIYVILFVAIVSFDIINGKWLEKPIRSNSAKNERLAGIRI